jgi:nucleoside-diphosphate-sugar epimerase
VKIAVTGATGNVGTSVLRILGADDDIESITGIARRTPTITFPKTTWAPADVGKDELRRLFEDVDCVIHLAWLIQPSRDLGVLSATNVEGSRRVFEAAAETGVTSLIYASSIGTYSAGDKKTLVDESWPSDGIPTSFYSRHKAETEKILDLVAEENPDLRVVRLRPALTFKREAAEGIRRLFFGPLAPVGLVGLLPLIPHVPGLRFQTVHSDDVAEAYRLAAKSNVAGAFNIAAEPVLETDNIARLVRAARLRVSKRLLRAGAAATWRLRLQPAPEGWVDMGVKSPLMDTARAVKELGWTPRYSSEYAVEDLLEGLRNHHSVATPPLSRATSGPARIREFATGVGRKSGAD